MASVKYEEHFDFPQGKIYLLMDAEWGVELTGEEGKGGDLVGMGAWDFSTREAWTAWGDACEDYMNELSEQFYNGTIDYDTLIDSVYNIDHIMSEQIETALVTEPV